MTKFIKAFMRVSRLWPNASLWDVLGLSLWLMR